MKKPLLAAVLATASLAFAACSPAEVTTTPVAQAADFDTAAPPTIAQSAAANSEATVVSEDDWSMEDAVDAPAEITEAGVYRVTQGQVVVSAPDDALVVLVLDGADLDGITVNSADDVALYLQGESTSGPVYSEADLTISGPGTLTVDAPEDGIVSKDDLVVAGGTLNVKAGDDGLRGTDSLTITGGTVTVEATGGDALKSSKDDDETKGWVEVSGGTLKLKAGDDGIAAATDVAIVGGTTAIEATDKAVTAGAYILMEGGELGIDAGDDGLHSDGGLRLSGGNATISAGDDGVHAEVAAVLDGADVKVAESTEGIEGGLITISAGTVDVTASDDGVNASGSTTAAAGEAAIAAAEKETEVEQETGAEQEAGAEQANPPEPPAGMPEDMPAGIPGEMPEGMPGEMPEGMPGEMPQGMGGPGGMDASTGEQLTISGGNLTVNADGDGLDSNGDITMTGGTATVWGPTNNGNGALDYAGTFNITGGTLLAVGSAGMASAPSESSTQGWISVAASGSQGDTVSIKDADGAEVASFSAVKDFANVVYSDPSVNDGATYTAGDATATAGEATAAGPGTSGQPRRRGEFSGGGES